MLERGDLLLVPFPFTDLSAAKRRPVLALTAADGYGDFIALPVTRRVRNPNTHCRSPEPIWPAVRCRSQAGFVQIAW
jgi:mRNA interferase MazF